MCQMLCKFPLEGYKRLRQDHFLFGLCGFFFLERAGWEMDIHSTPNKLIVLYVVCHRSLFLPQLCGKPVLALDSPAVSCVLTPKSGQLKDIYPFFFFLWFCHGHSLDPNLWAQLSLLLDATLLQMPSPPLPPLATNAASTVASLWCEHHPTYTDRGTQGNCLQHLAEV